MSEIKVPDVDDKLAILNVITTLMVKVEALDKAALLTHEIFGDITKLISDLNDRMSQLEGHVSVLQGSAELAGNIMSLASDKIDALDSRIDILERPRD